MTGDISVHAALVLDGEDMFRAVLLIHRPVVDKLIEQLVFAGVDDLLGIVDGLLIVGLLITLALLRAGLRPFQIYLREQGRGCQR